MRLFNCYENMKVLNSLLRIHLILNRIRMRTGKKWIRIHVLSLKFTKVFLTNQFFVLFLLFFFAETCNKLDIEIRKFLKTPFFQQFRFEL